MRRRTFLGALAAAATLTGTATVASARERSQEALEPGFVVDAPGLREAVVGPDGRYAYGAVGNALEVYDCDSVDDPERLGRTAARMNDTTMRQLADAVVAGDRVLLAGPYGFVDDGQPAGASIFDVSDPAAAEQVTTIETDHAVHNAAFDGDLVCLTGYMLPEQPVVVYDVTGDEPAEVARWSVLSENDAWRGVNRSLYQCHDITLRGNRAYVSYWDAGTWILDVSDPGDPTPVTQIGGVDPESYPDGETDPFAEVGQLPGNSHNAELSPDGSLLAIGREAFDRAPSDDRYGGPGGIELYDVTDETNPELVTAIQPPVVENAESERSVATVHNFAFRDRRLYTSWYSSGVRVYDLSDPGNPAVLGAWAAPLEASFWAAEPLDDGFVGASYQQPSASTDGPPTGENAKLYTFPEPDAANAEPATTLRVNETGIPEEPPDYDLPAETTTGDATTADATAGDATTESAGTSGTDATPGTTPSDASPTESGDGSTGGSVPGFGVAAAVAGTALAALHRLRDD